MANLTGVLAVMWLSSYGFYTSLGLDTERVEGTGVRFTHYRVRWPGDGSFRVGVFSNRRAKEGAPVEPFDLGGAFFQPARRDVPRSLWNRLGFWWLSESEAQEGESHAWTFWLGIPSGLPPLLTGAWVVVLARRGGPPAAS